MKVPKTWPENQAPTAEQWLDWLLANDRDEQLEIAAHVLQDNERAFQCAVHHGWRP